MEKSQVIEEQFNQNWSEAVEDLLTGGDSEAAISLLETVVSQLETLSPSETVNLQLASTLTELSKLFSAKNFSLKSDQLLSRASLLQQTALQSRSYSDVDTGKQDLNEDEFLNSNASLPLNDSVRVGSCVDGCYEESLRRPHDSSLCNGSSDDDWEAIADRAPNEFLASPGLPSVSNLSLQDTTSQGLKRRGRGTFSYEQDKLYSDRQSDVFFKVNDKEDKDSFGSIHMQQNAESINSKCGTQHVLVLADFPPSTRTIDLEKLFQDFTDRVLIRWVCDTEALAVFQTPSIALEARNTVHCPFKVRILDEDDILLSSIPEKDLEPPRRRPQTSARTAQRLIAQGMGLKFPATTFGSKELKKQEEARKNRIAMRQKMIEDAWGGDEK